MPIAVVILLLVCSSLCYGTSSVLQDRAVRSNPNPARAHIHRLIRLLLQPTYLTALALSAIGFAAQIPPFQIFPLFVVQTAQVANLAVVAIVGIPLLGLRVRVRDWLSIIGVTAGLVLLVISLSTHHGPAPQAGLRLLIVPWEVALAIGGYAAGRLSDALSYMPLGFIAGLAFGTVGVAVRLLTTHPFYGVFRNPALYALLFGGIMGFMFYAAGLERGQVTSTTAALLLAQIGASALFGILVLGDRTRPGYALVAIVGVAISIIAALYLARFARIADVGRETPTAKQ
jgi:drug/metabolite transporter (DMT)-like permease